jgi:RNA polymerase-binding transcription factor DksA
MTKKKMEQYRKQLQQMATQFGDTANSLEDQASVPTGGQSAGNLSNMPMHLGDVGSEVYTQELNAVLYENEQLLRDAVGDALERIDQGTFGRCESCGTEIPTERLDALPYVRYCTACAARIEPGGKGTVNINVGRGESRYNATAPRVVGARPPGNGDGVEGVAKIDLESGVVPPQTDADEDVHAVGTPGGGTAVGGLAGTNIGDGDPYNADLEEAMGSSEFDVEIAADSNIENEADMTGPDRTVKRPPAKKQPAKRKTKKK